MTFAEFMKSSAGNPFLVRAGAMHMMNRYAVSPYPAVQKVSMELARTARAMLGVMELTVDMEWDRLMKSKSRRERKKLQSDRKRWKKSMMLGREAMAIEQVELESLTWQ